jgi:hypothetical protein
MMHLAQEGLHVNSWRANKGARLFFDRDFSFLLPHSTSRRKRAQPLASDSSMSYHEAPEPALTSQ